MKGFDSGTFTNSSEATVNLVLDAEVVLECCEMKGISDFDLNAIFSIVGGYDCITPNGTLINATQSLKPLKDFDCCTSTESEYSFYNQSKRLCSECNDSDSFLNANGTECLECTIQEDCRPQNNTGVCDKSMGVYVCNECEDGFFLEENSKFCTPCKQEPQDSCLAYNDTRCIGLCEENSSSKKILYIALSLTLSVFFILLIIGAVFFYKMRGKKKKMFGVSLEEWLNDDGRNIELHTDEEYTTVTGKDGIHISSVAKNEENYSGVDEESTNILLETETSEFQLNKNNDAANNDVANNGHVTIGLQSASEPYQNGNLIEKSTRSILPIHDERCATLGVQPVVASEN
eukprot:Awhi_evm3s5144